MEMTSFVPKEKKIFEGGGGQIGVHRKIHTGKLDFPPLPD